VCGCRVHSKAKRTKEIAGFLLVHSTHSRLLNRLCICGVEKSFPTPPSNLSMSGSGYERRCEDVILQGLVVPEEGGLQFTLPGTIKPHMPLWI